MRRRIPLLLFILLVSQLAGCALLHELQPHRLHRWNRGPAPSLDPEFTTMKADEPSPVIRAQQ